MSLASVEGLRKLLGRELSAEERAKSQALLDGASDLVVGYLSCEPEPVPPAVARVVARMVVRVLAQDAAAGDGALIGVSQVGATAGPFSQQRTLVDGSGSGAA